MTAPLLTPLETPIFDEDVIKEMEGNLDEVIPCGICDAQAFIRVSMRCCGDPAMWCRPHWAIWRTNLLMNLAVAAWSRCTTCGHTFPAGSRVPDVVREVEL